MVGYLNGSYRSSVLLHERGRLVEREPIPFMVNETSAHRLECYPLSLNAEASGLSLEGHLRIFTVKRTLDTSVATLRQVPPFLNRVTVSLQVLEPGPPVFA